MAAIGDYICADETTVTVLGEGPADNHPEVTAMVLGRRLDMQASDLQPQYAEEMSTGYQENARLQDLPQAQQMTYVRPLATPSRPSRMPHWFGAGFIERVTSIAHWPFLVGKRHTPLTVGMAYGKLPYKSPGWDQSRVNILNNPSVAYGDLTALSPIIYPASEDV